MDIYNLTRNFWNFSFENPEKINPGHSAIFFFAIEHCNRLGWKEKFGFPSQMVMEAIGIKNWKTYNKYLNDLIDWGFIKMIEKSKNQYSSNIIAIVKNTKALDKALDKALSKHSTKHSQSTVSINIQDNKQTINTNNNIIDKSIIKSETFGKEEINNMQAIIKKEVLNLRLIYKSGKYERKRIQNILTGKEFGNICELSKMTREQFVIEIIKLSGKLDFWNGKIYNAETFYKHYASIYNEARRIKTEKDNKNQNIESVF